MCFMHAHICAVTTLDFFPKEKQGSHLFIALILLICFKIFNEKMYFPCFNNLAHQAYSWHSDLGRHP